MFTCFFLKSVNSIDSIQTIHSKIDFHCAFLCLLSIPFENYVFHWIFFRFAFQHWISSFIHFHDTSCHINFPFIAKFLPKECPFCSQMKYEIAKWTKKIIKLTLIMFRFGTFGAFSTFGTNSWLLWRYRRWRWWWLWNWMSFRCTTCRCVGIRCRWSLCSKHGSPLSLQSLNYLQLL